MGLPRLLFTRPFVPGAKWSQDRVEGKGGIFHPCSAEFLPLGDNPLTDTPRMFGTPRQFSRNWQ